MTKNTNVMGTMEVKVNNETKGGNDMLLNLNQINVLGAAVYGEKFIGEARKAFQFIDPKQSYRNFTKTSLGILHNKVSLVGDTKEIYSKSWSTKLDIKGIKKPLIGLELIKSSVQQDELNISNEIKEYNEDTRMVEVRKDIFNDEEFEAFSNYFSILNSYGCRVAILYKVKLANKLGNIETKVRVVWDYKNYRTFSVDFPLINKEGFFITNGNKYAAMYTIANRFDLLTGLTKELELVHPYSWLCKKLIEVYTSEDGVINNYTEDVFDNIVNFFACEKNSTLQNKLNKVLSNMKEYNWSEDYVTPIIYIDKGSSKVTRASYANNILFDFNYDELVQLGHIEGVDFLTGSTSTPAKRCQVAANWKLVRHGSVVKLEKINNSTSLVGDYSCKFKYSYPAFVKTSAKRDNSSTVKDTNSYVNAQAYTRKFKNLSKGGLCDSTLNDVMKTLFVAKIHLPEFLPENLQLLELVPNTNDCFLLNKETANRMTVKTKMPKEDLMIELTPNCGSKFIGSFRDKGSITAIMDKYIPVVFYQCNNIEEVNNLVKALKEMRGIDTRYVIDKENFILKFSIDMIANPSTGRDNVAALLTQSCMEQKGILEDREILMSSIEVGNIDVVELITSRTFDHRVVLVDRITYDIAYDFGIVPIMVEDFFWQPKHDNSFYCKEKEISLNYHQAVDGMKVLIPTLYDSMVNSLDYASIKEDLLLLGMTYKEGGIANNLVSSSIIEDIVEFEDEENLLG